MGFGKKTDLSTGKTLDLDKTYKNIMFYNSDGFYTIKDKYNNIIFGTLPHVYTDDYSIFVYDLLYQLSADFDTIRVCGVQKLTHFGAKNNT